MLADEVRILKFDTEAQFNIWKAKNPNAQILNIDFISTPLDGGNSGSIPVPEMYSFVALEEQTNLTFDGDFEYEPFTNKLKVFLNGFYMTLNKDYIEIDSKTIVMNEPLAAGDIVAVMVDNGYFTNIDSAQIMNSYKIFISYVEPQTVSEAQVKNINISINSLGINITWEDVFGVYYEESFGPDWKEQEGFINSLQYMDFVDWRGVKIVRKEGSEPIDLTDGVVISEVIKPNQHLVIPFVDGPEDLLDGTTYYYGIFPYDVWGIYNFSSSNVVSIKYIEENSNVNNPNNPNSSYITFEQDKLENLEELTVNWVDPAMENIERTELIIYDNHLLEEGEVVPISSKGDGNQSAKITEFKGGPLINGKVYYFKIVSYDENNNPLMSEVFSKEIETILDDVVIDFNDNKWMEYFTNKDEVKIIDDPTNSNNKCLIMQSDNINTNRFNITQNTIINLNLEPIEFARAGSVLIHFKVYTSPYSAFNVDIKNKEKTLIKDSGYYLEFKLARFKVEPGYSEIQLTLSSNSLNDNVLIDKIVFER